MADFKVPTMGEMLALGESPEVLFWVGCAGSFDDRAKRITKAIAKILNYGKLKYEEKKKQQASKKKQHVVKVKEIRVRPRIDTHDLETKVNLGRKFILDGCKLKVTLMYRGRELSRTDLGLAVLDRVREMFSDIAEVEKEGNLEGRRQTIVLTGK